MLRGEGDDALRHGYYSMAVRNLTRIHAYFLEMVQYIDPFYLI